MASSGWRFLAYVLHLQPQEFVYLSKPSVMRIFLVLISSCLVLFGCQNEGGAEQQTITLVSTETSEPVTYQLESIPGTHTQIATYYSDEGQLLESGIIQDGKRSGNWTFFTGGTEFPTKVISFVEGRYTGIYLEFNDSGQGELMATYKDNKLNGPWGEFRFGRPEMTANYKDGELDGIRREYDYSTGKLLKEASFKAGQLDGLVRDYDEEGRVMVEYMYREGEKISGGVIERE